MKLFSGSVQSPANGLTKDMEKMNGAPISGQEYFVWDERGDPDRTMIHRPQGPKDKTLDVRDWRNWAPAVRTLNQSVQGAEEYEGFTIRQQNGLFVAQAIGGPPFRTFTGSTLEEVKSKIDNA